MIQFLAHFLYVLAAWTLTVKFALPIAFAIAEGAPPSRYVMWDFWWVAHIALGWSLLHWRRYTYAFAMTVSVVEIGIVATKFMWFLADPQWTIWRMNWFVNKIFVLTCFIMLLVYLVARRRALTGAALPRR